MATANDIAQNAAYVGDAALGGGNFGVITVDTKPLQDLAYYSMLANKYKHEEKKKETDDKIKELADISNISLNSLRDKDKKQATEEFNKLVDFYREQAYISPQTTEGKIKQQLELQTKKRDFMDNYNSGKGRALTYLKIESDINNDVGLNGKQKEVKLSRLNEKFNTTDIGTTITAVEDFKIDNIELPKSKKTIFDTVSIGGNEDIVSTISLDVPSNDLGAAIATVMGLSIFAKRNTDEYKILSDAEKVEADLNNSTASTAQVWATMAEPLNEVLPTYIDDKGNFRSEDFKKDFASNKTILNAYLGLETMSKKNEARKNEAKAGVFSDNNVQFKLPINIKPEDFDAGIIDFSKPITPVQLVLSGMSAKAEPDKVEKKVIETNLAIEKNKNALGWANLKLDTDEFGLKQKQFEASQKGSETQVNGAMERAKRIYGDLQAIAGADGIISPDEIRKLNAEQLKYLGTEVPDSIDEATGKIIKGGFRALDLDINKKQHAIVLKDGNIQVLAPKGDNVNLEKLDNGSYVGQYDNTKSSNIFNVATNILNEELKTAGSKELNSYWGVDVTGGNTSFTQEKSSTVNSTSQSTTGSKTMKGKDGKVYSSTDGITWVAPDGTTVRLKQ